MNSFTRVILSLFVLWRLSSSFTPQKTAIFRPKRSELHFFRRGNSGDAEGGEEDSSFLSRFGIGRKNEDKSSEASEAPTAVAVETVVDTPAETTSATPITKVSQPKPKVVELSPAEQAAALKAQAEKIRLEAELEEAELTLSKIAKLEKEISQAQKTKGADVEQLQREMDVLQAKMRGETPAPLVSTPKVADKVAESQPPATRVMPANGYRISKPMPTKEFDAEAFESVKGFIQSAPEFLQRSLASQVDLTMENLNTTELAIRVDKMKRYDFSYSGREDPRFTREEIDEKIAYLGKGWGKQMLDAHLRDAAAGNETELALLALEYEYYTLSSVLELTPDQLAEIAGDDEDVQRLAKAMYVCRSKNAKYND